MKFFRAFVLRGIALVLLLGIGASGVCIAAADALPLADGEVMEGQTVTLRAEVDGGSEPFTFQWYKNGVALSPDIGPVLTLASIRPDDAGAYVVTAFNPHGMAVSLPEIVTVRAVQQSRLANVSMVLADGEAASVGFTLSGSGTTGSTPLLIRAAGPALAQLGLTGTLADPIIRLLTDLQVIDSNDDWGGSERLTAAAVAVGAFPFPPTSKDSALTALLPRSNYTVEVADGGGRRGVVVVELYDTSGAGRQTTPRLTNISARARVGLNGGKLVAGFTIQGEAPVTVLVRGAGPALGALGVADTLADPRLVLYRGDVVVGENDSWSERNAPAITGAASAVGAFAFPGSSADAAILVTLQPGAYTAQVSSANTASGIALIEVYEVP